MSKAYFTFIIHDHQPVGNFGHVIEEAYKLAYSPFIEVISGYPAIPFGIHISGPLWEWLDLNHPEFWEKLMPLAERGQAEIIGGGFYEPILPVLPVRDQIAQLAMMNDKIQNRFGKKPRGAWTTERVWEPQTPQPFAQCGIRYTFLDDTHFNMAGVPSGALDGIYLTGHLEDEMLLFPISQRMRYAVPFASPEAAVSKILEMKRPDRDTLVCLADDGEKFGLWRGTYDTCYRQKWLERFLNELVNHRDQVEVITPAEASDHFKPRGKLYLPAASYFEMTEWALPADTSSALVSMRRELEESGDLERFQPFLKGGHWRNFFAKYEESSRIYYRMLHVSRRIASLPIDNPETASAVQDLFRSQCNCAYWHGVFGGLYLPHLRGALWEHLIKAEKTCDTIENSHPAAELVDIDGDGEREIRLKGSALALTVKPDNGRIDDIETGAPAFNLVDTLSRRPEAYHKHIATASESGVSNGSIHNTVSVKEPHLDNLLVYDRYPRRCAVDHLFTELNDLSALESGDTRLETDASSRFELNGLKVSIPLAGEFSGNQVRYTKFIHLEPEEPHLECRYEFRNLNKATGKLRFGSEWCINLRDGHSDQAYYEIAGVDLNDRCLDSRGITGDVRQVDLVCGWLGVRVRLVIDPPAILWRTPLQTVSASDSGMERIFQGSIMMMSWALKPGFNCSVKLQVL